MCVWIKDTYSTNQKNVSESTTLVWKYALCCTMTVLNVPKVYCTGSVAAVATQHCGAADKHYATPTTQTQLTTTDRQAISDILHQIICTMW